MPELVDIAEFNSEKFRPVLPDEAQVNPGVFGAELAWWLCTELAVRGVVTSYPEYEDWGWYLNHSTQSGAEFAIHCGNVSGGIAGLCRSACSAEDSSAATNPHSPRRRLSSLRSEAFSLPSHPSPVWIGAFRMSADNGAACCGHTGT